MINHPDMLAEIVRQRHAEMITAADQYRRAKQVRRRRELRRKLQRPGFRAEGAFLRRAVLAWRTFSAWRIGWSRRRQGHGSEDYSAHCPTPRRTDLPPWRPPTRRLEGCAAHLASEED